MKQELTDEAFWDNYWKTLQIPSQVNYRFSFDRCLANYMEKLIPGIAPGSRLLEIGAAPGKWLAYFGKKGDFKLSGIEYSLPGADAMKRNFEILNLSIDELHVGDFFKLEPKPAFDVVMSFGFIEHFENPLSVIERHLAWLKPGGILILGVPNFDSIHGILQRSLKKSILDVHNLSIMNTKFFRDISDALQLEALDIRYIGGFEPDLPITEPGVGLRTFFPKAALKILKVLRKAKVWDNVNNSWLSSYIISAYRKH